MPMLRRSNHTTRTRQTLCDAVRLGKLFEHRLECLELVATREGEERLVLIGAMRHIGLEHALHDPRRVLPLDVPIDLAYACLAPFRNFLRMALGIGERKAAAGVAGA